MAESANVKVNINSKADLKGFKQVESATAKLTKNVKSLAASFGIAFGARAVTQFGKASVKAFIDDDNAARSLGVTLKNLGLDYGNTATSVNNFISNLERQTGVLDDELRPAMDRLLRATGSVAKAQQLLALGLDISAGTGKDLTTVSQGLQKAFLGNNASLGRLGVGLSKAELTASSFADIEVKLTKLFAGQASSAAESYAGQINKLTVASNNAKEAIGKGIIDALTLLGKDTNVSDLATDMESVANYVANVTRGMGVLLSQLDRIPGGFAFDVAQIPILGAYLDLMFEAGARLDRISQVGAQRNPIQSGSYLNTQIKITKLTKEQTAAELAKLKAKKDQLALDKAALALGKGQNVFDMDAIQLNAALLSSTQALSKATSQTQLLSIANDLARLTIKQDMLVLEDAIAAKDVEGATAAAKKLNTDIAILGTLSGQTLKLANIKTILESILPKSLIDLANLDAAIAKIIEMNRLQGTKTLVPANTPNAVIPTVITPTVTPTATAAQGGKLGTITQAETTILLQTALGTDALFEYWEAATAAANAAADLLDYQNAQNEAAFKASSLFNAGATVNISAGVIASPDEFARMVQKAVQNANRFGNNLDYAGAI